MKKYIFIILVIAFMLPGCKKSSLQLANPNNPTPLALNSEAGIESFAMGVFAKWIANVPGEGNTNIMQIALMMHSNMGDEDFSPYGNWGMRYSSNVASITLPAPYNKTWTNPSGLIQKEILASFNSRKAGESNSTQYEWNVCNYMNVQANTLLVALDNSALTFSGDAVTKKGILKAWGYWWKGFAYSRLGSMYISAIINNEGGTGITNGKFSDHATVITEANVNFDKAAAILATLTENADYDAVFKTIVPNFNLNSNIVTPAMWIRQINTYKARNILANSKVATMTADDWSKVSALTVTGMVKGDFSFYFGMAPGAINDLSNNFYHPFAFHASGNSFAFVSERLVQEFKSNDKRLMINYNFLTTPVVNIRNRGIQFGTRYLVVDIENGGTYSTDNSMGATSIGGTWEENSLMIAEGKIRTGSDIDGGLALVDAIRDAQGAGIMHVANTGLSQVQAIEEFRRERRVALYLRGIAFYDARRWGVTTSVANGGGRMGANILVPAGSLTGSSSAMIVPCLVDYNYLDYWDVPQNELDFNAPSVGSAPVKN